jgi:hypothetical protein
VSSLRWDARSRCSGEYGKFREAIPSNHGYQFLIHDRDSIFSRQLDKQLKSDFDLKVLRTPVRAPTANSYCERLVGTVRRKCLDFHDSPERAPSADDVASLGDAL